MDEEPVLAHAIVRLDDQLAAPVLDGLRQDANITQPAEVKFHHFRKKKGLRTLAQALSVGGPLHGRVLIAVVDKKFMIVADMINQLVEERAKSRGLDIHTNNSGREMARTLYLEGSRALGDRWLPLLSDFVHFGRSSARRGARTTVDQLFTRIKDAQLRCHRRKVEEILIELLDTRREAETFATRLENPERGVSPLEPLFKLLTVSLQNCTQRYGSVRLLHDENKLFSADIVGNYVNDLQYLPRLPPRVPRVDLADFRLGSSHQHPSIQLADLIASAGRVVLKGIIGGASAESEALQEAVLPHVVEPWLLPFDDLNGYARRQQQRAAMNSERESPHRRPLEL